MNELDWEPRDKFDIVPPAEDISNEHMEDFFVDLFEATGKPSVQQARKWINHILAKYKPSINFSKTLNNEFIFKIKNRTKYFGNINFKNKND